MSEPNDKMSRVNRVWRLAHPILSWGLGAGLFMWVTLSGRGDQAPEWYLVIGALLGFPFITAFGETIRKP